MFAMSAVMYIVLILALIGLIIALKVVKRRQ